MCLYHYYSETLNKGHAHRGLVILSIIERLQSCSQTFLLTHKVIHMDLLLSNKKREGLVDFYDVEWKSLQPGPMKRGYIVRIPCPLLRWSLYLLEISMTFMSLPVSLSLCQKTMGR